VKVHLVQVVVRPCLRDTTGYQTR